MDDNNFTYLEDIIDLDEPGNDNENNNTSMYSHYSEPPKHMSTSHDFNSIRGGMSTHEMFNQSRQMQQQPQPQQYLPSSSGHSKYGQYTPISKVEDYSSSHSMMDRHGLPTFSGRKKKSSHTTQLTDKKISELTTKYDELCYICKKLNDKDRVRYHYIYNIIIVFLFLVILLLVKKVLNI